MFLFSLSDLFLDANYGLFVWTSLIFFVFWGMILKLAYRPLADALEKRNGEIQDALDEAGKARLEMEHLKAENAKMMEKAKAEQAEILAEAKATKAEIIEEAKIKAQEEADKIIANAKLEIENQKKSAIADVKKESSLVALAIAEKVIKKQLNTDADQDSLMNDLINNIKFN
ncbi:MAG TPA: ATP synthase F0 subunit B [Phaeodactylibacter sp.]|nr:ATP synthase F0 subunit B [Phaeodactylibacter sp.]